MTLGYTPEISTVTGGYVNCVNLRRVVLVLLILTSNFGTSKSFTDSLTQLFVYGTCDNTRPVAVVMKQYFCAVILYRYHDGPHI